MTLPRKKALFLYFELAGYVQASVEQLAASHEVEVHLMRYPIVAVAPFQFNLKENIKLYERKDYNNSSLIELVKHINPDFVFICGWADKGYLGVAKYLKKKIPVVLSLDNPWLGTLKQRVASLMGPLYLPALFTHCWVPGEPNAKYARKLGFKNERLLMGMYSADTPLFANYEVQNRENKKQSFPHRFIFMGRYTELKGIRELWTAFSSLTTEERKDWELWCIGKGELDAEFPDHPSIKKIGFIQPEELAPYLAQTGVFILPAHYEHWGVVVHEFAAAGFPLICSSTTSAATAFLHEGKNGFFTQPKSVSSVREALIKIIQLNDDVLLSMGEESKKLSQNITPKIWADTVWKIMEQ